MRADLEKDLAQLVAGQIPSIAKLEELLQAPESLQRKIRALADQRTRAIFQNTVYLRGIIEISNYCRKNCAYCGIRGDNSRTSRYRMNLTEVLAVCRKMRQLGVCTVVLQAGEDPFFSKEVIGAWLMAIKAESGLAITLSLGVQDKDTLAYWRQCGLDRYLLRFETADQQAFDRFHPDDNLGQRLACIEDLRELKVQIGSGFLIGLPGANERAVAQDIIFCTKLKLAMIGCGPFLAHPHTPLRKNRPPFESSLYLTVIALLRLLNPLSHIPATTAFDALIAGGRLALLRSGANVFMPNCTPLNYRQKYLLYPHKPAVDLEFEDAIQKVKLRLSELGLKIGQGPGHAIGF